MTLITHIAEVRRESLRANVVRLDLGGTLFPFVAGQAILAGATPGTGRTPYSLACSPRQSLDSGCLELLVTVDPTGTAGRHLGDLARGSAVAVDGPLGSFTLAAHRRARRLLFIAGGTGIAPLRAMLWDALTWDAPPDIDVLYSARTPEEFAYVDELSALHTAGRIRLRRTVTRGAGDDWDGGRRRIDRNLLASLVDPLSTVCLVCGPDSFVDDVPTWLYALAVPASRVLREEY
ncbi:MAG: FAD-binding oxidoreductase [Acidobacteria bacterium]|nr:FAD-binding oxidoreductase [Acidobacteriota bacterium]